MSIAAMKAIQMVYANTTKHDWPDDIWEAICQAIEAEKQSDSVEPVGSCGKMWTSPRALPGLFCALFSLYRPFLSARLAYGNSPKSTRPWVRGQQNQRLTSGRIEWFADTFGRRTELRSFLFVRKSHLKHADHHYFCVTL